MGKRINATHYEDIPIFTDREAKRSSVVNAIIETPKGSRHKYALNAPYGIIAFHEILPDDLHWPVDYGFVPKTLAADGDALDIVVLTPNALFSGCLIPVRVLGAVHQYQDGVENDRLIAVPLPSEGAPAPSDAYRELTDLPGNQLADTISFLGEYSRRQGHIIEEAGLFDAALAMDLIKKTAKAFRRNGKR